MKRRKVIAEVLDPGDCRYYHKGQKFILGFFTPAGLCGSAYGVLSRDAQTLRYGGKLPWEKNGVVLTRCPDPHGALWRLRLANDSDIEVVTSAAVEKGDRACKASDCYEVNACYGIEGSCSFSLVGRSGLSEDIVQVVKKSAWGQAAANRKVSESLHYKQLRVALAACPNACTQPQIKDIGIMANCVPVDIGPDCNGCGRCEAVCQEDAIVLREGVAELLPQRCVGCGVCASECVQGAIESDGVQFRVLIGGRMGRHPRWAQELCVVDGSCVVRVVGNFLERIAQWAKPSERLASVVERVGAARLREEIFP